MPKLGEIPHDVDIPSGGSVVVTLSPDADVGVVVGEKYTTYAFPVRLENGKDSVLKGGMKLLSAIEFAMEGATEPRKLRIRVTGRGGFSVNWNVEKVV